MELFRTTVAGILEALNNRSMLDILVQLLMLLFAGVAAFFIHRATLKALNRQLQQEQLSGLRSTLLKVGQRLAFPLSALSAVWVGSLLFNHFGYQTLLLNLVTKLLLALAAVRLIVYALRVGIAPGPALKAWEKVISTMIWVMVALIILDWLPAVEAFLDQIALTVGESRAHGAETGGAGCTLCTAGPVDLGCNRAATEEGKDHQRQLAGGYFQGHQGQPADSGVFTGDDRGRAESRFPDHLRRCTGCRYWFWPAEDCQQLHQWFHPAG